MSTPHALLAVLLATTSTAAPAAMESMQNIESIAYSFSDTADIISRAPIVARLTITKAQRLRGDLAVGVASGHDRYLITGQVVTLLRGDGGIQARIEYLVDLPANQKTKLKKQPFLIAAAPVPDRPGMVRLISAKAQMLWTLALEARVRALLTELVAPGAPPPVTGIGTAFHVPGSLPGESETQIFLRTATEAPVSLNILRRPGEAPHWTVALGEMVDDAAKAPAPETLLWYRLACGLPAKLPESSLAALPPRDAEAAAADYALVMASLGPCGRTPA